ncbi:peptidoglycan-binding protein [Sporosarcina sp. NPDC096371]|uniref:peptidoglycan-binding domain-containing protein n=1 Tax=Sporosarcina sp. NPDC096371 TaxID=3364530 RepID=UPI00382D662E
MEGHFGATTDGALRDFQKKNILPVDGKAGPATIGKLKMPVESAPPKKEEEVLEDKEARADKSFQTGQDFVKASEISDGTYPRRPITRQEVWAMLELMDRILKK